MTYMLPVCDLRAEQARPLGHHHARRRRQGQEAERGRRAQGAIVPHPRREFLLCSRFRPSRLTRCRRSGQHPPPRAWPPANRLGTPQDHRARHHHQRQLEGRVSVRHCVSTCLLSSLLILGRAGCARRATRRTSRPSGVGSSTHHRRMVGNAWAESVPRS